MYILSKPPEDWKYSKGRLDLEILQTQLPPATLPGTIIMICGPPGLNNSVAGVKDPDTRLRGPGILNEMGFSAEQIHVFE